MMNVISTDNKKNHIIIGIVSCILFLPFLGNVHLFDWDEINFAEAAREMIVTGDWLRVHIDFLPFWEKPPLFIWLQAISMSVFGINEFAARLPNALVGIITLQILFYIGRKIHDTKFALWWVIAHTASFLPHFYFRSGIIDPLFNTCIFTSLWFLYRWNSENSIKYSIYAGICTGAAILTKGPVGFLLPMIVVGCLLIMQYKTIFSKIQGIILYIVSAIFIASLWFGVEYIQNGSWFIEEFIRYQIRLLTTGDAGHSQPWYYHSLIILIGCFPASIYALFAFRSAWNEPKHFSRWMIVLFFTVLIVFSVVQTKIVHYSSLAYFPVTYLAAYMIERLLSGEYFKKNISKILFTSYSIIHFIWFALFALLCCIGFNIEYVVSITKGQFEKANLSAPVVWSGAELIVPAIMIIGLIGFLYFIRNGKYKKAIISGFSSTLCSILFFLPLVAPNIEGYTQHSIISFYEKSATENCYVQPIFFKTYAHLFYGRRRLEQSPASVGKQSGEFEEWLKTGNIDKPVYFVAKIGDRHHLDEIPEAKQVGDYHGFLVYKRETNQH